MLPVDGSSREFVLRKEHNHPPLIGESLKGEFIKQLKRAIVNSPLKTPRDIYEDLSEV